MGVEGTHGQSVDCLSDWGIAIWPVQSYGTNTATTRAEFAALLSRMFDATGNAGQGSTSHTFSDLLDHPYAPAIGRLSSLGIIGGYPDGTFRPDQTITRAQMATMLIQAASTVYGLQFAPKAPLGFVDVNPGGTHTQNIALIAGADITQGVAPDRFDPSGLVTRGQVTTFTARLLNVAVDRGAASRPSDAASSRWRDGSTGIDPGWNQGVFERQFEMSNNFDYARFPLCSEHARWWMVGTFAGHATGDQIELGFDDRHTAQSCVWSRNSSPMIVRVWQQSASVWRTAAEFETAGCEVYDPQFMLEWTGIPGVGSFAQCINQSPTEVYLQMGLHVYQVRFDGVNISAGEGASQAGRTLAWLAPTAAIIEGIDPQIPELGSNWR